MRKTAKAGGVLLGGAPTTLGQLWRFVMVAGMDPLAITAGLGSLPPGQASQ